MQMKEPYSRRSYLRNSGLAAAAVVTRNAWSAAAVEPSLPQFAALSLEQQVGQMIIARLPDWPLMEKFAKQGLISGMTPGLTKFTPAEVAAFTNRFQELSPLPLLLGWGGISYSGGTAVDLQRSMRLGASRNAELCRAAGRIEAIEARSLGFHLAGAPVLDVNLNPGNTIINLRSFGDDAELVARLGRELARGFVEGGLAPVLCHFPGHGATSGDSHIEMPVAERTLAELEAVEMHPFADLIREGLARVICTNHCHYPALDPERQPATLSRKIVTGLLREKLGFEGVIMSDSLTMKPIKDHYGIEEAAILTVLAGHDLILQDYHSDPKITIDALARAVRQGRLPPAQVERSVHRVWKLKQDLGLFQNRRSDVRRIPEVFATRESAEIARRIARESVTLLENRLQITAKTKVLVLSNGSSATVDEDNAFQHSPTNHRLNEWIRQRVPNAKAIVLSTTMKPEEMERSCAAALEAEVILCGLFTRVRSYVEDAILVPEPYRKLIERLAAAGRQLALLNFGNPYVLAGLPRPAFSLCTYSDSENSVQAAVATLFGELKPLGKLPVRVSARYPFGHGLVN